MVRPDPPMSAADHYRLAAEGWEAAQAVSDPSVRALLMAEAMRSAAAGTEEIAAEREALVLSLMPGRTCAEVGAMLDMSAANVSRISSRARAKEWGPAPTPTRRVTSAETRADDLTLAREAWAVAAESATRGALTRKGAPAVDVRDMARDTRLLMRHGSEELRGFAATNPPPRFTRAGIQSARRMSA